MLPPRWFTDTAASPIQNLLRWFLLRLAGQGADQRQRPLRLSLTPKTIPQLFDYSDQEEIEYLWSLMVELAAAPYRIWDIEPLSKTQRAYPQVLPSELRLSLVLNLSAEQSLRQWLAMPLISASTHAWRQAITAWISPYKPRLEYALTALEPPGVYPAETILTGLSSLLEAYTKGHLTTISWRQLSARFFAGDSKYLDAPKRQLWLLQLLPELGEQIHARKLLLNVHLVAKPRGLLLIENLDTYCLLRTQSEALAAIAHLHLVYSQGFTASAGRIRNKDDTLLSFSGASPQQAAFEDYWYSPDAPADWQIFFWGDLDFSALHILNALAGQFNGIGAWPPAYLAMAAALAGGMGHNAIAADKAGQRAPDTCRCAFAQTQLLPVLLAENQFIDQEWLDLEHLVAC